MQATGEMYEFYTEIFEKVFTTTAQKTPSFYDIKFNDLTLNFH